MKKALLLIIAIISVFGLTVETSAKSHTPQNVVLPTHSTEPHTVKITTKREAVTVSTDSQWFGIVGGNQNISAKRQQNITLWFEPNFSTRKRSGSIVVKEVKSGTTTTIEVSQPPYFKECKEGFPARLESSKFASQHWESDGICSPYNSPAVMSVVSVSGMPINFVNNKGPYVSGTHKGDYFIYAVPTKHVAAGEQIDFMCTLIGTQPTSPKYFIFEYWDNNRWNCIEEELRTVKGSNDIKYSFYNKYFESHHHTTYTQSFTLSQPIDNDCVKVRLRILSDGEGPTKISGGRYMGMYLIKYSDAPKVTDRKKILFVGNSFTYYFGTAFMLKEIARSQGHQIDAIISVKGGQEFSEHLLLERSREAIERGGFDYAFLQDSSPNPAIYADKGSQSILKACKKINALTLSHSPNCQIIYERTWACPKSNYRGFGDYDRLDYMLKKGTEMLRKELDNTVWISPIGLGFRLGRAEGLDLLHTDNHHQSRVGAYMKACINYLLLYKEPFTDTVSNCALDAATAQKVREIAEQVVLQGVEESYDF